tara:strand:- start:5220 stop:5879 length:660 start_codon:yes stop_codon:yes gene_type:complete
MDEPNAEKLRLVLDKYAVPDPKIVGKLPRGNIKLDYVGHAEITRILTEIDPLWKLEPLKIDDDGLPAYRVENGMAHMMGALTLLGHTRLGIGSAPHNKQDLFKELWSDLIRNTAMRFSICVSLWSKEEWGGESDVAPAPKKKAPAKKAPEPVPVADDELADTQVIEKFVNACKGAGLDPTEVCRHADVPADAVLDFNVPTATIADLDRLRSSFKELISK